MVIDYEVFQQLPPSNYSVQIASSMLALAQTFSAKNSYKATSFQTLVKRLNSNAGTYSFSLWEVEFNEDNEFNLTKQLTENVVNVENYTLNVDEWVTCSLNNVYIEEGKIYAIRISRLGAGILGIGYRLRSEITISNPGPAYNINPVLGNSELNNRYSIIMRGEYYYPTNSLSSNFLYPTNADDGTVVILDKENLYQEAGYAEIVTSGGGSIGGQWYMDGFQTIPTDRQITKIEAEVKLRNPDSRFATFYLTDENFSLVDSTTYDYYRIQTLTENFETKLARFDDFQKLNLNNKNFRIYCITDVGMEIYYFRLRYFYKMLGVNNQINYVTS